MKKRLINIGLGITVLGVVLFGLFIYLVSTRFVYYHVPDSFLEAGEMKGLEKRQFVNFKSPINYKHDEAIIKNGIVAAKDPNNSDMLLARIKSEKSENGWYDVIFIQTDGTTSTGQVHYDWISARD